MKIQKKNLKKAVSTIETTLGELVETITQIAMQVGRSEKEAYALASLAVEDILKTRCRSHLSQPNL